MELTKNEEDYLKVLFMLSVEAGNDMVGTNHLAADLGLAPASANGMLKKLTEKNLVYNEKHGKWVLTDQGKSIALQLIRKHRLWETFLYEKLEFTWDEVHEVAEQLEHIHSKKLIEKLDKFLGYPEFDPHGDPIPNEKGKYKAVRKLTLSEVPSGSTCKLIAVKDSSAAFLQYVSEIGLGIRSQIKVIGRQAFDNSIRIEVDGTEVQVSEKFAMNIFVVTV